MTRRRLVILALLGVIGSLVVLGGLLPLPALTERQLEALEGQLDTELERADYPAAFRTATRLVEARPADRWKHYSLACVLARLGKNPEALAALSNAVANGFEHAQWAERDADLASLRADPRFATLLEQVRENDRRGFGPIEQTPVLEGVKTVERSPAGGLRYRLRLPVNAAASSPARLVLWLHPTGHSFSDGAETLVPMLNRAGFGLLVPVQKDWTGWTDYDLEKLFARSVADAATLEGVDARRPVLLGFSGGGQTAIQEWTRHPGRFGGLVLVAAYPIPRGPVYTEAPNELVALPEDPAGREVPIFVAVGDEGVNVWHQASQQWGTRGPRLTLARAEGLGHAWTIIPTVERALEQWLGELARIP